MALEQGKLDSTRGIADGQTRTRTARAEEQPGTARQRERCTLQSYHREARKPLYDVPRHALNMDVSKARGSVAGLVCRKSLVGHGRMNHYGRDSNNNSESRARDQAARHAMRAQHARDWQL